MDTASWRNQIGVYNKAVFPMQIVLWDCILFWAGVYGAVVLIRSWKLSGKEGYHE